MLTIYEHVYLTWFIWQDLLIFISVLTFNTVIYFTIAVCIYSTETDNQSSIYCCLQPFVNSEQLQNQNITCNWAISPNLGEKIRSCMFYLKIGTHGILEVLIPNAHLDFWNSVFKTHFWANFWAKKWKLSILPENWHT